MYVVPGADHDDPSTLVWATKDGVMSAILEAVAGARRAARRLGLAGPAVRRPVGLAQGVAEEPPRKASRAP